MIGIQREIKYIFCQTLQKFSYFFLLFSVFLHKKMLKEHISTSVGSVQHPNTGRNTQQRKREREGVRRCLRRIPQGAITLKCEVRQGSGFKILVIAWEKNSGCVSHLCYYFFTLALLLSHFPPMFFLLIFPTVMALIFPGLLSERGGKKLRVEVEKNWKFKKKEKMKVRWRVKKF